MDTEKLMERAIELACENVKKGEGGPFGALVVKNGVIISTGVNTVTSDNDPTAHAEINAIRKATQKLKRFRLNDCQIFCSCEPCPMCLGAIYWAGIKTIWYAADKRDAEKAGFIDNLIYNDLNKKPDDRVVETIQLAESKGDTPFRLWLATENRKEY